MSKARPIHHLSLDEEYQIRGKIPFHLGTFLYNHEKGTVMNRDKASWGKFQQKKNTTKLLKGEYKIN